MKTYVNKYQVFVLSVLLFTILLIKYFFRRTETVAWSRFLKELSSISQNSSENTCVGVLSFSEVAE